MRLIFVSVLILMFANTIQARDDYLYVGIGAGSTYLKNDDANLDQINKVSQSFTGYVGYRVSTEIALELDVVQNGSYEYTSGDIDDVATYYSSSLSIVVIYPLIWDDINIYTPLGISGVYADYGVDDDGALGYKLGIGMSYTPMKHITFRVGVDALLIDLENGSLAYNQNLNSMYGSIQYNF